MARSAAHGLSLDSPESCAGRELYQKLAWPFSHASPVMLAQRWPLTFTCQSMELRERGWTCGHGIDGEMRRQNGAEGSKGQEQFKEAGERTMAPWAATPTTNDAAETRRRAISQTLATTT